MSLPSEKFPMGVLAPGPAHARPFARPHNQHEQKNFGAHVCKVILKHLPQPLTSHIQNFRIVLEKFHTPFRENSSPVAYQMLLLLLVAE